MEEQTMGKQGICRISKSFALLKWTILTSQLQLLNVNNSYKHSAMACNTILVTVIHLSEHSKREKKYHNPIWGQSIYQVMEPAWKER